MIGSERIELSLPARADMLFLVRLHVAAAATQMNVGLDAVEDLRLAIDELCLMLLAGTVDGCSRLDVVLLWDGDSVEVVCGVTEPAGHAPPATAAPVLGEQPPPLSLALSRYVLDVLADEHGDFSADGQAVSWLRKRFRSSDEATGLQTQ